MSEAIPEDVTELVRNEFGKATPQWVKRAIGAVIAHEGRAEFDLPVIEKLSDTGKFRIGTSFEDSPGRTVSEAPFQGRLPATMQSIRRRRSGLRPTPATKGPFRQ